MRLEGNAELGHIDTVGIGVDLGQIVEVGGNDVRLSHMGPDGDPAYDAIESAKARGANYGIQRDECDQRYFDNAHLLRP